ncbi:cellulose biosynthesis cyclic di-GMP-binding regulatory protein BcsB [Gracilibacillus sp. S3-1-1]|uniref:Cellulose biosynthesis cyclic di-GMP-binding regulatory protein BcsB n=1 Tax=Gracilibacillus pellucidus TaxID=3095368 RepID=A0ACC6M627_9BACI|nr:cellulose biosynthesis cyclic di-GMP-binding regulatory protein BcsB [Gracilibacillus sp. S3-1-1]MDX8046438.1 cellulose biosynthesis cyclic di-GMP-binding regulatory protein BcsB [Gracilibacillus sp. S3-1-1]
MKKMLVLFIYVVVGYGLFINLATSVQAKEPVELEGMSIKVNSNTSAQQALTTEAIELIGPAAETNFYYEIFSELEDDEHYVSFSITNSELLMEPSALTVMIDGEPVQSISLAGETEQEVKIPLEGSALEPGIHTITVSFSGTIIEGVCVSQYSTGNWLTIQPNSFLNLDGEVNLSSATTLNDYPRLYVGSESNKVQVIMPKEASMMTQQSAYTIASYLADQSTPASVSVVSEDSVESLTGNIVLLGGTDEFESEWIKRALQDELSTVNEDALYVTQITLTDKKHMVNALVALADDPETLVTNIRLLTNNETVEQLSSEDVQLKDAEQLLAAKTLDRHTIELTDLGLTDVLLDQANTKTSTYYYDLPVDKYNISDLTVDLTFKWSEETIPTSDKDELLDVLRQTKLKVIINDVPHGIVLDELAEDDNGLITAQIPVDPKIVQKNQMLTFQLDTSGLQTDGMCISTEKWLYIFDDSKLVLNVTDNQADSPTFIDRFPFPFTNKGEDLVIVVPKEAPTEDLQQLFSSLSINNQLPNIRLVLTDDVSEEELASGNVIFVGALKEHPILRHNRDKLNVLYEEDAPSLASYGFLQSEVEQYAFVQENIWNGDYHLAVFDGNQNTNHYLSEEFLSYLRTTDNQANIAVQTESEQFFTYETQSDNEQIEGDNEGPNTETISKIGFVIAFIILVIVIVGLIYYFMRKRKSVE